MFARIPPNKAFCRSVVGLKFDEIDVFDFSLASRIDSRIGQRFATYIAIILKISRKNLPFITQNCN